MRESTGNMEELARSKPIHRGDTVVVGRRATRTSANVNVEDDQNVALTILWVSSRRNGVCKQSRCGAYSNIRVMTERRRCGVSCLSTLCEIINQKLTNNALDLFLPAQPQQHKRQNRKYADVYKPKGTLRLPLALVVAAITHNMRAASDEREPQGCVHELLHVSVLPTHRNSETQKTPRTRVLVG